MLCEILNILLFCLTRKQKLRCLISVLVLLLFIVTILAMLNLVWLIGFQTSETATARIMKDGVTFAFDELSPSTKVLTEQQGDNSHLMYPTPNTTRINVITTNQTECLSVIQRLKIKYTQALVTPTPVINVNCKKLFEGDWKERLAQRDRVRGWKNKIKDSHFMRTFTNCSEAISKFNIFYVSEIEISFPLAFQFLIHYKPTQVQQYIRLIQYLYRSHNIYCIHIDSKAPQWWINSIRQFASCFSNILIPKQLIKVQYLSVSILDAHLSCLKELHNVRNQVSWRYVISLHSTEIPLVTNREMVTQLIKLNGSNAIDEGEYALDPNAPSHFFLTHEAKWINGEYSETNTTISGIPYNMSVYKSSESPNSALTPEFVKFVISDQRAVALRHRLHKVKSAEEYFFTTLNHLKQAPGNIYTIQKGVEMPNISRREWRGSIDMSEVCLEGHFVHDVCIASIHDLKRLLTASEQQRWWFYNKYQIEYDHVVMNCMEDIVANRNINEFINDHCYNMT